MKLLWARSSHIYVAATSMSPCVPQSAKLFNLFCSALEQVNRLCTTLKRNGQRAFDIGMPHVPQSCVRAILLSHMFSVCTQIHIICTMYIYSMYSSIRSASRAFRGSMFFVCTYLHPPTLWNFVLWDRASAVLQRKILPYHMP